MNQQKRQVIAEGCARTDVRQKQTGHLFVLNQVVATRIEHGEAVTTSSASKDSPEPKKRVTADWIQPAQV